MASFASANATANGAMIGEGLTLAAVREDCKPVVIGIDFGTAFSGVAFALKSLPGNVMYGAPSATDPIQTKVPTALLQLPGDKWEFGYKAESMYAEMLSAIDQSAGELPAGNIYKNFKMALKNRESGFDTLTAFSMSGNKCLLLTLVTKSLEFLKDYALSLAEVQYHGKLVAKEDVQWVLTVPAIWNDFGKAFMRKAAFQAGMMETEQSANLMLVLEPEGAALAVHVGASQHGLLGTGSRFMVLDCGGGTIDITVHDVETLSPLSMKAIMAPSGGPWGGTQVNAEFQKFLKELLDVDETVEQALMREFYTIYAAFETMKVMYEPGTPPANLQVVDVLDRKGELIERANTWNGNHPEKPINITPLTGSGILSMSKELMMSFFEPSLLATVEETKRVMREMPCIRYIMVVGGYGSSKVLTGRIRDEFHQKAGVQVIMPDANPKPQGAIVHGAVYFGLHKNIISSRVSPYTYGVAVYEDGVDEVFSILVQKGQELPHDHLAEMLGSPLYEDQEALTWRVYRSDKTDPITVEGEHLLGPGVRVLCPFDEDPDNRDQTGKFYFGGSEIRVFIEDVFGNITQSHISMV